ncbi:MAG: hypothetical protein RL071_2311, partial [Pseudomonadota bacterium]
IGKHEDLAAATRDDVSEFFRTWYVPNNASLSIVGDFDPAEAKKLVELYFGDIPKGPEVRSLKERPAALSEEKVVRKEHKVPDPKVWVAWLSPKLFAPGDAEMDALSLLLADGKDSRLYKRLVIDKKVAKSVAAFQYSAALQSQFIIEATAAEGRTTDELVREIDAVLAELREKGPSADEVVIARTSMERGFWESLQTISGKADLLNNYNIRTGNPGFIGQDLARYNALTAPALHEVARAVLVADKRVVLHVNPPPVAAAPAASGK